MLWSSRLRSNYVHYLLQFGAIVRLFKAIKCFLRASITALEVTDAADNCWKSPLCLRIAHLSIAGFLMILD